MWSVMTLLSTWQVLTWPMAGSTGSSTFAGIPFPKEKWTEGKVIGLFLWGNWFVRHFPQCYWRGIVKLREWHWRILNVFWKTWRICSPHVKLRAIFHLFEIIPLLFIWNNVIISKTDFLSKKNKSRFFISVNLVPVRNDSDMRMFFHSYMNNTLQICNLCFNSVAKDNNI